MPVTAVPVWAPTPEQVHALIPVRPMFTATSRPSVTEVLGLIGMAVDSMAAESAAADGLDPYEGKVRYAVALNVASQVEVSFFPEQQDGADAPGPLLYARYLAELLGVRSLLAKAGTGAAPGPASPMGSESMLAGYLPWGVWPA